MTAGDTGTAAGVDIAYGEARGRWVIAATVLGSGVAFIDATVVNIALPSIGEDLDAGVAGLTWTVNAYTLTLAALILLGGALGDRLGRRRMFAVGVSWFALASLLCGLAPNIETLVAARALQGIGGALLTPGSLAILQATFRAEDRSRAIGVWSGLAGVAGAIGPFLGGWLLGLGTWRWIFLINLPVAAIVLLITMRHVPESKDPAASPHTDLTGAALVALGLGLLTYGLTAWAELGITALQVQATLIGGVLALTGFVLWERRAREPMLPLDVFGVRQFSAANAVTFVVYAALGGVFLWLVVTLQVVAGFSPLEAGLALLPVTVLMLLLSPRAGVLGERLGPRLPMTAGPLLAAVGVAALTRVGPESDYLVDVLAPVIVLGLGLTLTVTPLTATALGALPDSRAGLASGVNNAVARTAGLLAIAVLPVLAGLGPGGFGDPATLEPAFVQAMWVCAGLLALGGLAAAVLIRNPAPSEEPESTCPRMHCAVDGPPIATTHHG